MPKGRGKFINHKGKHRSFTNPDELEEQRKREEKERQWRAERGEASSSEDEEAEGKKSSEESDSEEETSSEEEEGKAKGVEGLIQVENPNRVQTKAKKLSTLNTELSAPTSSKPELSRREREELEKQRAAANYQRLHAKGKTEEARADLARLAIIKAQREEAAKKRAEEAKSKEVEKQKKTQETQKALGKRS